MLDTDTDELVTLATRGFGQRTMDYFHRVDASSNTSCGLALRTGKQAYFNFDPDSRDHAVRLHVEDGVLSAQSAPLVSRSGKPIGMVSTHWGEPYHRPSERELRFLDLLARQAADLLDQRAAAATLRESEERQAFLLKPSDILQRLTAPNEMKTAAMQMLGEHLGVSRAQYHEVDSSGEYYSADGIGYADGLPLLDLKYRIDQFGSFVAEDFEAGRPFRSDDLLTDPRPTAEEREAYGFYQIRAGAGIPMLRGGKLVAILAVHDMRPHPWTDLEMELIRETAERVWVRSEEHTSELQSRQYLVCRLLLETKPLPSPLFPSTLSYTYPHFVACICPTPVMSAWTLHPTHCCQLPAPPAESSLEHTSRSMSYF